LIFAGIILFIMLTLLLSNNVGSEVLILLATFTACLLAIYPAFRIADIHHPSTMRFMSMTISLLVVLSIHTTFFN